MPRLLMIAAMAYPPSRGSGTMRALGFTRHLAEFGWEAEVLTIDEALLGEHGDASLAMRVPRGIALLPITPLEYRLRRAPQGGNGASLTAASASSDAAPRGSFVKRTAANLLSFIFGQEIFPGVLWASRAATRPAAGRCDLIFSTSPPISNHLIARRLHRITRKPWIADFRDPYAVGAVKSITSGRRRAERLEAAILKEASAVVVVSPAMKEIYLRRFPDIHADKIRVITNGYDHDLAERAATIRAARPEERTAPLHILHAGLLYNVDCLETLCRAIREVGHTVGEAGHASSEGGRASKKVGRSIEKVASPVELEWVGHVPPTSLEVFRRHGLTPILPGRVSQAEAFDRMCRADVLFAEAGESIAHYAIRAKLFEYLLTGLPIIGLMKPGPSADVIRRTRSGAALDPVDVAGLAKFLSRCLVAKREGRLHALYPDRDIAAYDRRVLTGELSDLMNRLIERSSVAP